MEECIEDMRYEGLHPHLEQIFSCHKCKKQNEIPFAAVGGGSSFTKITEINAWGLSDFSNGKTYKDNKGGRGVFCSTATASAFKIDPSKWTFPTNCALGLLNVDAQPDASNSTKNVGIDRSKLAVFCGACKPGYRAVYGMDNANPSKKVDFVITSCEPITNCEESTAFNNCTKCQSGFGFAYENGEVRYDKCLTLPQMQGETNNDCFAYDQTNLKCVFCCRGTYLNKDGFCERITPPKCDY